MMDLSLSHFHTLLLVLSDIHNITYKIIKCHALIQIKFYIYLIFIRLATYLPINVSRLYFDHNVFVEA